MLTKDQIEEIDAVRKSHDGRISVPSTDLLITTALTLWARVDRLERALRLRKEQG